MKTISIAALGDSLLKGVVLTDRNRYSVLDDSFINIVSRELDFRVDNFAKFGCTVNFGHNVIDRHSDELSDYDYTFLEYGGNDCDFDWMKIADDPHSEHHPKTLLQNFKEQFLGLVRRIVELGSKPIIISLPPIDSEIYFNFISRAMNQQQKDNVMKWLGGDVNIIERWHESYNQALFEISEKTGTPIIDITTPFRRDGASIKELVCSDGIHPNQAGHKLIANSISNMYF